MENQNENKNDTNFYNVEVFGDYFVSTAEGNMLRPFGPVKLKMRIWQSCQSLARFHILPNLLRKVDPEFGDIRRCIVLGVTTHDNNAVHGLPIKFMDRKQIAMEAKSNNIPLRVDMYPDIIKLRQKLHLARTDRDRFNKGEQRYIRAYEKIGDALDLNANIFDEIVKRNSPSDDINLLNKPTANQEKKDVIDSAKDTFTPKDEIPVNVDNANANDNDGDEFSL